MHDELVQAIPNFSRTARGSWTPRLVNVALSWRL